MRRMIVTNGDWNVSGTTGSGIPTGMIQTNFFRVRKGRNGNLYQYGDKSGLTVSSKDFDSLTLIHGYSKFYTKNYREFIMSRAARKRGYRTVNAQYNRRAQSFRPCQCGRKWVTSGDCFLCYFDKKK